jgi:hypothetical protein
MRTAFIVTLFVAWAHSTNAQTQEAAQLLLNYEKLKQLEEILDNMYKGYKTLTQGYERIKGIAEGNYKLHHVFLDGLLSVSPTVKKYKRIPQIIAYQQMLVKEYKRAYSRFKGDEHLTTEEIRYLGNVYGYLFKQSLRNLEELAMIITASKVRMSDDERLMAIDRIYYDIVNKLSFLRYFNNSTQILIIQRAKERNDIDAAETLYQLNE